MKRLLFIVAVVLVCSCTTTRYVEVPVVHEIHHHHTDSIHKTDSVTKEKETVIMQLDSAAMAQYGIQLKNAERAWLVRTAELEKKLSELSEIHTDTVYQCDSIPYPVEVTKEIPAELTWWQKTRLSLGNICLWVLLIIAIVLGVKYIIMRFVKP